MEIVLYLEVNLICIAILFSIFIRDAQQRNNDTYHILFTRVLFSNIAFFVADILWGLMSLSREPHIVTNWIANILYFSMSGVAAYFWLVFVEKMIHSEHKKSVIRAVLRMLPATILIALSVISVKTHWLFYIDAAGKYQRGDLYILQPILAYLLPVYATLMSVRAIMKTKSNDKKRQYRSLALFYVLPAIGGICQVLIQGTPMLNIGIALSGLWLYFTFQDNVTMLDPLTGMNNRRSFDRGLETVIRNYSPESGKHLYLILMDVDYFKKINDGFGHAEGDKALVTVADTLKDASNNYDCTAARIGGDEFAVYWESENKDITESLCESIRNTLADKSMRYPFRLQLSMGCAEYKTEMTSQQLYIAADKELYRAKNMR